MEKVVKIGKKNLTNIILLILVKVMSNHISLKKITLICNNDVNSYMLKLKSSGAVIFIIRVYLLRMLCN